MCEKIYRETDADYISKKDLLKKPRVQKLINNLLKSKLLKEINLQTKKK